jgi:DNA helicase-2/ATP-dependent DNA helicase PcrA
VGDRKQSIYDFRGADDTLLDEIAVENGVTVLPLSLSRRPTDRLLQVQNVLFDSIGSNPIFVTLREPLEPYEGTISPLSGIAPLTYISAYGGSIEGNLQARLVATASEITRLLGLSIDDPKTGELRGVEPGDIVLLMRSNSGLQRYLTGLPPLLPPNIEIRPETGGRFFQRAEIIASYRMLQLILEYDHTVLSMALHTPYLKAANPNETEQWILQYQPDEGSPLKDWFEDKHPVYSQKLKELRAAVRSDTVPQILSRLYDAFKIREHYRDRGDNQAVENLEKLREMARHLFKNEQALMLRQLVDLLRVNILRAHDESDAIVEPDEDAQRPPYIRIMTIHAAKGLEFPLVVIPEVQSPLLNPDNDPSFLIIPGWGLDIDLPTNDINTRSPQFQNELNLIRQRRLREEMRLFYVAVTRAQHAVTLIGTKRLPIRLNNPEDNFYAWQDEVLRAQSLLSSLGADFLFQ